MEVIFINTFPSNQCHDAFDGEGSSVDKVSVKKVLVIWAGVLIELENVEQVVILSVDVTTNCEFLLVFNCVVNKGWVFEADVFTLLNKLECVSFVEAFLVFVVFHQFYHPEIRIICTIQKLLTLSTRDEGQSIIFKLQFISSSNKAFRF